MMQGTDRVSATLTAEQWNIVLAGLNELPYRASAPVIGALMPQLQAAEQPANDELQQAAE